MQKNQQRIFGLPCNPGFLRYGWPAVERDYYVLSRFR
jgi:hypothetical protein